MKQILRRLGTLAVTLLLISFLIFVIFQIIPGDGAVSRLGTNATPEQIAALRKELHLDDPFFKRYFNWLFGLFRGDFGNSYKYDRSVAELIGGKLKVTFFLAMESFLLIVLISLPVGIFLGRTAKKPIGAVLHVTTQIFMAVPSFFTGILIILIFGLGLKLFVPYYFVRPENSFIGFLGCMIPGAFAIAIPKISMVSRFLRTNVLEESRKDYVRTAYSKGAGEKHVFYHHILKNAILPVITILGMTIAEIMAGSIVVEQVFGLPGLGQLLISSINTRDFPVVSVIILYMAFVVIVMNTIVDILYQCIDPRITMED